MESALGKLTIQEKEEAEFEIPVEDFQREEINYELCLLGKLSINGRQGSGEDQADVDFLYTYIWAQFYGLPLGSASEALAKSIGNLMGTYLEYDSANRRSSWNSFMRVRVRINVEESLMRKKIIRKQGAAPMEISFSYEQLPLICYLCGIIGHSETSCPKLFEQSEQELGWEWPEEIYAEVQARTVRRMEQWRRDPGSEISADFTPQNLDASYSQSGGKNPHRIGNRFSFYPKKITFKPNVGAPSNVGHQSAEENGWRLATLGDDSVFSQLLQHTSIPSTPSASTYRQLVMLWSLWYHRNL
ncbi:hypothetical protein K2173_022868 [Erythroxylum novogranatense]|uniref:CCHC-type domain-containing protein n=1 Tax=Erythroxylum novogranatense TaxID=1862640 RepID=A0AAV8TVF1_9ROSI|nr:hypothetical protein K2173_022868 [Erythroxylum novogranatense]